jgi:hypothetical protein
LSLAELALCPVGSLAKSENKFSFFASLPTVIQTLYRGVRTNSTQHCLITQKRCQKRINWDN